MVLLYKIEIDNREKDLSLIWYLRKNFDSDVIELKYGDYHVISTDYYIERKSWSDLFLSITENRLDKQLIKMIEKNLKFILVIHGKPDFSYTNNPMLHAIQCYNKALSYTLSGIKVVFAEDNYHFKLVLDYLIKNKITELTDMNAKIKHISAPISLLSSIRGIGIKKAEKLLSENGNIKNIMNNIDKINISKSLKDNIKSAFML